MRNHFLAIIAKIAALIGILIIARMLEICQCSHISLNSISISAVKAFSGLDSYLVSLACMGAWIPSLLLSCLLSCLTGVAAWIPPLVCYLLSLAWLHGYHYLSIWWILSINDEHIIFGWHHTHIFISMLVMGQCHN